MPPETTPPASYRALLGIPFLARVVVSMQLARISGAMVGVALVLFTLLEYESPPLAGLVTFASIIPGLVISPLAGALLDRHGRVRLVQLDYLIAAGALLLVGGLSRAGALEPWLLVLIAAVASLTNPLSATGLRSLFPVMVPRRLWERVNAVDSNGYVVATIVGPPLAALLVSALGAALGLMLIALPLVIAALILVGVREPRTDASTTGRLLLDAWQGLTYVARNPTLRGLGLTMTTLNLAGGATSIVVPLLVLEHLGGTELIVGAAFAVTGIGGMVSALVFGRQDTRGREWRMLWLSMLGTVPAALLLVPATVTGVEASIGYVLVIGSMLIAGLVNGPLDIALFTLRQRRTDTAWLGRAFAVSMAINFAGFPVGAAIAGAIADVSLEAAAMLAALACLGATVFAHALVPRTDARADARAERDAQRAT